MPFELYPQDFQRKMTILVWVLAEIPMILLRLTYFPLHWKNVMQTTNYHDGAHLQRQMMCEVEYLMAMVQKPY